MVRAEDATMKIFCGALLLLGLGGGSASADAVARNLQNRMIAGYRANLGIALRQNPGLNRVISNTDVMRVQQGLARQAQIYSNALRGRPDLH
jgi:hypothetical protein